MADRALITIAEGRRYVFRKDAPDPRDDLLADAINDVSDSIWSYLKREPKPTTGITALAAGIDDNDVSITVENADAPFPQTGTFKILVGSEIMLVTAGAATTTWTVTRAQDDTEAAAHADGATVNHIEARVFRYAGAGSLDLAPYDLRELASVVFYTDLVEGSQATLTTTQYRLEPRGRTPDGTYLALTVPYPSYVESEYGFGYEATVTGAWGMAETPGPIKLACKQWVDNIVKNPGSYQSNSMSGYTVVPEVDETAVRAGMPPAVMHRLEDWRRKKQSGISVVRFGHSGRSAPGVPHTLPTV